MTSTCFLWASHLHRIQPVHRSRWYSDIFDRMHLFPDWRLGRRSICYICTKEMQEQIPRSINNIFHRPQKLKRGFVWFDGISIIVGYLMPNPLYTYPHYTYILSIWFVLVWFYGISTIVDYLMPNTLYTYLLDLENLTWLFLWHIKHYRLFNAESIFIHIIIMTYHLHEFPWPSLTTQLYRPSLREGLQGYILYQYRAVVDIFEQVAQTLLVCVEGCTGVHHIWFSPYFPSCVPLVLFV